MPRITRIATTLDWPKNIPEMMAVGKRIVPVRESDVRRFMETVRAPENGCLPWGGYTGKNGYGYFGLACQVTVLAHRFAYVAWRGAIPARLQLDHQCHNRDLTCSGGNSCLHRHCVHPWSLKPVTGAENLASGRMTRPAETHRNGRKDHCPARHLYDEENTYWWSGMRTCKACRRLYQRALRAVKRGDYPSMAVALIEYGYYPPPDEVDILPTAKARGFQRSPAGVPASPTTARPGYPAWVLHRLHRQARRAPPHVHCALR